MVWRAAFAGAVLASCSILDCSESSVACFVAGDHLKLSGHLRPLPAPFTCADEHPRAHQQCAAKAHRSQQSLQQPCLPSASPFARSTTMGAPSALLASSSRQSLRAQTLAPGEAHQGAWRPGVGCCVSPRGAEAFRGRRRAWACSGAAATGEGSRLRLCQLELLRSVSRVNGAPLRACRWRSAPRQCPQMPTSCSKSLS